MSEEEEKSLREPIRMRLMTVYFCPNRMVAQYVSEDGREFFCEPLAGKWFKEFNSAEATESHVFPYKDKFDLLWDGERLIANPK